MGTDRQGQCCRLQLAEGIGLLIGFGPAYADFTTREVSRLEPSSVVGMVFEISIVLHPAGFGAVEL
jgi:hypothetical protein